MTREKSAEKSAAILTIKGANRMTPRGRRDIATWLKRHAAYIVKFGHEYSERFTGRYLYR